VLRENGGFVYFNDIKRLYTFLVCVTQISFSGRFGRKMLVGLVEKLRIKASLFDGFFKTSKKRGFWSGHGEFIDFFSLKNDNIKIMKFLTRFMYNGNYDAIFDIYKNACLFFLKRFIFLTYAFCLIFYYTLINCR